MKLKLMLMHFIILIHINVKGSVVLAIRYRLVRPESCSRSLLLVGICASGMDAFASKHALVSVPPVPDLVRRGEVAS